MIGKIAGRIDYIAEDHVLIEAMGVGYEVWCSTRTLASMPPAGEVTALYTQLLVREDLLQLFGFPTREEREWHRLLTSVQGVGAKVGLAILGTLGPEGAARAITLGDASAVKQAPGVGPKLAQRIVLELKGKAPALMAMGGGGSARAEAQVIETDAPKPKRSKAPKVDDAAVAAAAARAQARADAMSALTNLGYAEGEAAQAIATVEMEGGGGDAQTLIRAALKALAKNL